MQLEDQVYVCNIDHGFFLSVSGFLNRRSEIHFVLKEAFVELTNALLTPAKNKIFGTHLGEVW
jgi:hypothetical protein